MVSQWQEPWIIRRALLEFNNMRFFAETLKILMTVIAINLRWNQNQKKDCDSKNGRSVCHDRPIGLHQLFAKHEEHVYFSNA